MAGNRLFFPVQAVIFYSGEVWNALERKAEGGGADPYGFIPTDEIDDFKPHVAHGVQDVNVTSNFALTPVFELGQSEVYENTEGIPTVEITLSKVLDGKPLLWHLATLDAVSPTLIARIAAYSTFQLGLWPDTEKRCFWKGGSTIAADNSIDELPDKQVTPIGVITCPKCFPSSLGYTISTTEASKENLTLSGNEKVWARAMPSRKKLPDGSDAFTIIGDARFNSAYADFRDDNDRPDRRITQGYNVMLKPNPSINPALPANLDKNGALKDPDCSVFPIEIPGINEYGVNDVLGMIHEPEEAYDPDPNYARIQSVTFNVNLTRNDINALGYKLPVYKSVQMPIQVTTEITAVSTTDDGIQVSSFTSACQNKEALRPSTIRLALCNGDEDNVDREDANGVRIYTGTQNKLTSVSFGQGGTGGGNVQATYQYQTNNTFTVVAKSDPNQNQEDLDGHSVPPVFVTDINDPKYGQIVTPGGWWVHRDQWVC